MIWGQSTSQLRTSKFQDINVVRIILKIKRDLEASLRHYIFELNQGSTWALMMSTVNNYLSDLMAQGAITSYNANAYATDYDITRHRVRVDVTIQPKQVIYQILLSISV